MQRGPAMAFAVVATLAIAIAANTTIFSAVYGVLIKPLSYPDSDRLIVVGHALPQIPDVGSSPFLYLVEREQNQTMEGVGLLGFGGVSVTGIGEPEQVRSLNVTSDILPILGVPPLLGREFSESDTIPGSPNTIILTYGYWQRRFGGDSRVISQYLTVNSEPYEIIGVMPREFWALDNRFDVIYPIRLDRSQVTVGNYFWRSIGRLKPGVTLEQAAADIRRMIPLAIDRFPLSPGLTRDGMQNAGLIPKVRPLRDEIVGNAANTLWVMMGTVGIVLLIACANVANLVLVRTESRHKELSTRAALGAGWGRIARQLLIESILLSLAGALLGIALAYVGLRVLIAMAPADVPRAGEIALDSTVLAFTLGLSLFSGLLFGSIPVARYANLRRARTILTTGRTASAPRERLRTRGILVIVQVSLALMLLISAGLMIRTYQQLSSVNPGFSRPNEIQTLQIDIPATRFPDPVLAVRKQNEILDALSALPGVTSAGYTSAIPMTYGATADLMVPEGRTFSAASPARSRQTRFISPGFFRTLGIPLLAGRDLTWTDVYERQAVVLVSEQFARLEWGNSDQAIGKRVRGSSTQDAWREIVGVVGEIHDRGLSQPVTETVYYPVLAEHVYNTPTYVWRYAAYAIHSRRAGTPEFVDEVRQAVWGIDPNLPLANIRTMQDILDESMERTSFTLAILAIAGAMALLLGLVGLYGAISYAISQRAREVGIRLALGAQTTQVQRMFLRQGLVLTAVGVALGLVGAVALTRAMGSLLFQVRPIDPITYTAVSAVLILASAVASYVPTRRATRVDVIDSLRAE
jgi:predicted permease